MPRSFWNHPPMSSGKPIRAAATDFADAGPVSGNRWLAFGGSLLPVALAGCLFLAWTTSLGVIALKQFGGARTPWFGGAIVYLVAAGALGGLLAKIPAGAEPRLVGALIALSAGVKLVLVLCFPHLPLNTDQAMFHYFVREMADGHLAGDILRRLSQIYDYPVWAGRALPIHYAVRRWSGGQDLLWIRMLNVGLSTALLATTYGFACRLLPRGRRKWVVGLMLALPFQWFVVTDYSHHLFSSFYFLACIWCGWELVFASPGRWRRLGLSAAIGICLVLMMWQRGMHLIALGVFGFLLAWAALAGCGWRRWGGLCLGLVVVPLALALPPAQRLDAWLARHDDGKLNSVLPAFVARGWCPESAGEYCGRYEQLDRVTPGPEKKAAMARLVLSQIRHNPRIVCGRFPFVKTAKLFLVGYAANFEESLAAGHSAVLPWARGMRLAAAPVFLGLALWGCLVLAFAPVAQVRWLPVLLAPLLTWGAYVFLGETSPRYSIFCQPFLALLGALALGGPGLGAHPLSGAAWRGLAIRAVLVVGLVAAALGSAVWAVGRIPEYRLYADLERGWGGGGEPGPVPWPGALRPFEVRLPWTPTTWRLPPHPETAGILSFYVLDVRGAPPDGRIAVRAGADVLFDRAAASLRFPQYVEAEIPAPAEELVFEGPGPGPGTWALGYVSFREKDGAP